jgi:hypothetical protein
MKDPLLLILSLSAVAWLLFHIKFVRLSLIDHSLLLLFIAALRLSAANLRSPENSFVLLLHTHTLS